ncbi:LytR/AlgR family response regulator transcription factor [Clostridium hydrogenum]|uniref:LytR/AlgR family response regulator transcription factor n=1 Tax=Clostridium hydrogenum TaxID=2855764 RepID=UPI002E362E95|nr:response regulator [Clostridium hydrogenum]
MILLYSIILAEDNSKEREILKAMILSKNETIKIYETDNRNSALEIAKKNFINMFLIDITLKESSGLELAMDIRRIHKYEFSEIIFFANHLDYILQAFKQIHCYDYILKPYNEAEVQVILDKLINNKINNLENKKSILDNELDVKIRNNIHVLVKISEILFIEVKDRDCEVNTIYGVYTYNNISLKKILELINCKYIVQSHKAFAVNINYIFKVEKINLKLGAIYFKDHPKTALLGYKFKNSIIEELKKNRSLC